LIEETKNVRETLAACESKVNLAPYSEPLRIPTLPPRYPVPNQPLPNPPRIQKRNKNNLHRTLPPHPQLPRVRRGNLTSPPHHPCSPSSSQRPCSSPSRRAWRGTRRRARSSCRRGRRGCRAWRRRFLCAVGSGRVGFWMRLLFPSTSVFIPLLLSFFFSSFLLLLFLFFALI